MKFDTKIAIIANREVVKKVKSEDLNLVGLALHGKKKAIDKILKGLSLHP